MNNTKIAKPEGYKPLLDFAIVDSPKTHRHDVKVCSYGCKNCSYTPRERNRNAIAFDKNVHALVI